MTGATGSLPPFMTINTSPADGQRLASKPATFTVHFNDFVLIPSVDSSDLLIDGVAASSVTVSDGKTVVFTLPALSEGLHGVTINAGAIFNAHGTPIQAFTSTFIIDVTGPRVVTSSLHEGNMAPAGSLTYTATFDEDMDTTVLDQSDFSLVGGWSGSYAAGSFSWIDTHTLQLRFSNLVDDMYTLTLASGSGRFQDLVGNALDGEAHTPFSLPSGDHSPGGNFIVHFAADISVGAFPTPLIAQAPMGSLIYEGSTNGAIGTDSDTDSFTISLDAGQTLTLAAVPSSTLQPVLTIVGPGGVNVGPITATAAGKQALLQTIAATAVGTYTVTVGSAGGSSGLYSLQLVLNAALEEESHDGASNNSFATAQSLDAAFLPLGGAAKRAGVIGTTDAIRQSIISKNMDTNPGWILQGQWASGAPTGSGSYNHDPTSGHTGTRVLGYNLAGDYPNNMPAYYATTPAFSTLGYTGVTLSFWRWLGVESSYYDHANIQISQDGINWTTVWENGTASISDIAWTQVTYDISAIADNQPRVYIRWGMGPTDSSVTYPGWNIDDVTVSGIISTTADYYRFDLAAGESATVALTSLAADDVTLQLYDSSMQLLTHSVTAENVNQVFDNFAAMSGGTYYLRITGNGAPYSLVVTKNASFDLEPNNGLTAAQDITGQTTVLGYVKQGIPGSHFEPAGSVLSSHDIYKLDDGTQENALGLGNGGDVLWLNCFDAIPGFEEISSVNLTWGPMSNGKVSKVLVYEDPNNDGDPTDAVLLTMADVSVANAGTNTFISVPITPVTVEGKFFIGAMVQNQVGGESPAPVDTNSSAHSSWIVGNTTPGGMDIYDLGNNDVPPVLLDDLGLPGNFLLRADGQAPVDTDWYSISVQAGNQLTISTATPAGGPQEFVNSLDPYIELYDPAGALVAWDDNSASDLKNAQITYTAAMTGNYTVRVLGARSSAGEYVLTVTGATGPLPPFMAINPTPADGQRFVAGPATFTVHFNDFVLIPSVDSSDLLIDGVAASGVTVSDDTTAVFTLPALSEGLHGVTINAGAIFNAHGTPIQAFTSTFIIDVTGPRVVTSSLHEGNMAAHREPDLHRYV